MNAVVFEHVPVAELPEKIWRDREDMADVTAYVRKLRQLRYRRDGSRDEP